MVFVDRLERAFKDCGIEPLMDRRDIYVFEAWWKRKYAAFAPSAS
jgi:hypothetical protein